MDIEMIIRNFQSRFISLAYRMTGDISASEDVVQDVLSEWAIHPRAEVENIGGYLSKSVANRCLNYLSAVKKEREAYKGIWLPEPVVSNEIKQFEFETDLSFGFMMILSKLTPSERAVFLLRESFGVEYSELSELLSLNQANCRQLYHRAKERLAERKKRFSLNKTIHASLISAFSTASKTGDIEKFVAMLKNDISVFSDGGGIVTAAVNSVKGLDHVTRFLQGLTKKGFLNRRFKQTFINGEPGFLIFNDDQVGAAIVLSVDHIGLENIYIVLNPCKLGHLNSCEINYCLNKPQSAVLNPLSSTAF